MNWYVNRKFGFSLVELMVVVAIIAIIASLVLSSIARSKDKANSAVCKNNLKQMSIAFQLYLDDNVNVFPTPGSRLTYGVHSEDWIWWQYGRGLSNSSIARYFGGFNSKVFTCPSDREAKTLQSEWLILNDPYRYSYALTSYNLTNTSTANGQTNWFNRGMASIITQSGDIYRFNVQQIRNPSAKIMLVEEDRKTIDDPRWIPHGRNPSLVSERHGKKGNVLFVDGHIESVVQNFGRNPTNSEPSF